MTDEIAISVKNLTKTYQLYNSHADRVKETFHPFRKKYHYPFNALSNVSFDVKKGETVGIIGRNGSGKSTLLQIICGILQPSSGTVQVSGTVSAILELGAGFNPEFTGRQNVYLNAAILGLEREEIEARFDDIAAFADIGDFIDQPVKTYSSGMHVRLAFAVAINVEPDILVVDEALAVGDEAFQRKCFSRIKTLQKRGGTILFVSHSAVAIVEICNIAILIDRGEVLISGPPKLVVSKYQKMVYAPPEKLDSLRQEIRNNSEQPTGDILESGDARSDRSKLEFGVRQEAELSAHHDSTMVPKSTIWYEQRGAYIEAPIITTIDNVVVNVLVRREEYVYSYKVHFQESASNVQFGMLIKTVSGFELGGAATSQMDGGIEYVQAGSAVRVKFRFRCLLLPGTYFINAGVLGMNLGKEVYLHRGIDVAMFRVQPDDHIIETAIVDFCVEPSVTIIDDGNKTTGE